MKHLLKYNESEKVSIFDSNWIKFLPKSLTIKTENGEFTFSRENKIDDTLNHPIDASNLMNCLQISYYHNNLDDSDGDALANGEPDYLSFDITFVKDNNGQFANPNTLRLSVDITYGDHMQYEFTIDKPNKVSVHHYTGKNSLHDPETFWGFSNKSLQSLIDFFNRFGFETTIHDFKFIDEYPDSYQYDSPIEKGNKLEPMIMGDTKSEVDKLKGGDKVNLNHLKRFNEMIKVPIKVGDTVFGGRFKNKKVVVKKIGKNAKGDITINDKPLLKFRIIKESFREDVEINLAHLIDDGFIIDVETSFSTLDDETSDNPNYNYMIRVWLPINKSDSDYSYENSKDFNWSDIEDEFVRGLDYITEHHEIEYLYTIASREQDGYGFKRMQWDFNKLIKDGTFGFANPGKIKCLMISVISHPQLTSL